MIFSGIKLSIAALALGSLAACAAPKAGSTNITSADAPASEQSAVVTKTNANANTNASSATAADAPEGDLVCRAPSNDGTTELYLKWTGNEASGTLRTIAPSGAVTDTRVRAQHYKSRIIADDVGSSDLVTHAAVVSEENGKRRIRVEEMGQARWADCSSSSIKPL